MLNIIEMKEVTDGIFIPDISFILHDTNDWLERNKGYSCVGNKYTKEFLMAFSNDVDALPYVFTHFDVDTLCIRGLPE